MPGITLQQLRASLIEKTLTPAEKKKREEVAKAIQRENPGMDKSMKMAIATATAKRVAEDAVSDYVAKGGKVTTAPYKQPRKSEKTDYSSKHIGGKGEHKSGKAANTTSPKPVGEEIEQIEELSKKTLASYVKKASSSSHPNSVSNLASRGAYKLANHQLNKNRTKDDDDGEKDDNKSYDRSKNIAKAVDRITREEIEDHSDPLSEEEYDRIRDTYGRGAAKSMMNSRWNPQHPQFYGKKSSTSSSTSSSADKHYHKVPYAQKDDAKKEGMRWDSGAKKWYHSSASASSASKFQKEEVEIMEGPMPASVIRQKTTLGNMSPTDLHGHFKEIASKRGKTVETSARETAWRHGYGHMSSHYWDKFKHLDTKSEEVVQVDEISKEKTQKYLNRAMDDFSHQDMGSRNANTAAERQQYAKKKVDRNKGISRAMLRLLHPKNEDVEQVNELKKSTLGSYVKKASWEAAINAASGRADPGKGYTKKSVKRLDGIERAVNKLTAKNEEVEQVNELKKSTLASYTGKVVDPVYGMPRSTSKLKQRLAGLQRAHQRAIGKKPTSEEVVSEGPYSSGQLKPTQAQLNQAQKVPSGGRTTVIRDKDEKGTYTQTMKDGKVVSKTYENFAADFLKMAKEKNPNARISTADQRKKEAEALAKSRSHLKPEYAPATGNPRPLGGYDPKSNRSYSEEVELDELNQLTLQRYASKAKSVGMQGGDKAAKHLAGAKRAKQKLKYGEYSEEVEIEEAKKVQMHKPGWMLRADPELAAKFKKIEDRKKAMNKNMAKYGGKTGEEIAKMPVKEETVQVNELSTSLLAKYKTAAAASAKEADKAGKFDLGHKRFKGMLKATSKQFQNIQAGKK